MSQKQTSVQAMERALTRLMATTTTTNTASPAVESALQTEEDIINSG